MLSSTLFTSALLAASAVAAPLTKRDFSGRATFYAVGQGNCGWYNSPSDFVVALNTAQYGSTSQASSTCGQSISITYNGNTQQATIVDSCPTCPYGGLDLSESLFSALTGGNMGLGQVQVSWNFGSGGSSSSSTASSSSSNNNNNNNNNNQQSQSQNQNNNNNNNNDANSSSSSSATPTPTPTPTSSASSSSSSSQAAAPAAVTPTNTATKLVTGTPQWWKEVGTSGCPNVQLPQGVLPIGIAPSGNAELDTLPAACGKWAQIWNDATNKSTKAMVANYMPEGARNTIYMGDAYLKIANMTEGSSWPQVVTSATWGFLN